MENKFKDFWLLGHQCDPDKLVFIMDESDAEITALKQELNEYDPNLPEEKSRLSPQRFIDDLKLALELANAENAKLRAALEEINREELNAQRPGGGYSRSAKISFEALKSVKK